MIVSLFLYCTYPLHTILCTVHGCNLHICQLVPTLSVAEVVSITNDSISLRWNSTDADDFVVYYKESTASTLYNATTTASEYNITDLFPFTLYHVTVSGRSVLGVSNTTVGSGASVVRTAESGKLSVFCTLVMIHDMSSPHHCHSLRSHTDQSQLGHNCDNSKLSCIVKPL